MTRRNPASALPMHMNGRIYDPLLGRFLSADPFIDGATTLQGWNRYSYLKNNPLNNTDPTGYYGGIMMSLPGNRNSYMEGFNGPVDVKERAARGGGIIAGAANTAVAVIGTVAELAQGDPTGAHPAALAAIDGEIDAYMESKGIDTSSPAYTDAKGNTEIVLTIGIGLAGARAGNKGRVDGNKIRPNAEESQKPDKKVPNPDGKKGGPKHQKVADSVASDIESRGLVAETEVKLKTVDGKKDTRFMDVVARDSETGEIVEVHQVGKGLKSNPKKPIARERDALRDVRNNPEVRDAKKVFHNYEEDG